MLSQSTISNINDQIGRELRIVKDWMKDDAEKDAALERIAKLKDLLNPQPSRTDILQELANALVNAHPNQPATPAPSPLTLIVELLGRNR